MSNPSPLDRTVDELELQAWLARAEFQNPSTHQHREELSALARLRDELRVQLALGKLDARDEWTRLEARWGDVKRHASTAAQGAGESLHDALHDLRESYHKLRG